MDHVIEQYLYMLYVCAICVICYTNGLYVVMLCKGRRPLAMRWLRVRAIIAEFNMGCYRVAR